MVAWPVHPPAKGPELGLMKGHLSADGPPPTHLWLTCDPAMLLPYRVHLMTRLWGGAGTATGPMTHLRTRCATATAQTLQHSPLVVPAQRPPDAGRSQYASRIAGEGGRVIGWTRWTPDRPTS